MSGWFGGGANAQVETTVLGGIRVQTSAYGLTIPVGYGRNLLAMNLLWYDDFKAIPHEERAEAGGKGGSGPVRTSYTYTASVIGGLCEGPVGGIRTVWVGKEKFVGVVASTKLLTTYEIAGVSTSPYQITLAHAATFANLISVILLGASWEETDIPLVEGGAFTRSGGVLTFSGPYVGRNVRVEYQYTTTTDAYSALGQLGLTLKPGTPGQSVWSHLTSDHSAAAIGYSGIAYVYAQDYQINNSAQVENHAFEIDFPLQLSASVPDCDPREVINDILSNPRHGVQLPSAHRDAFDSFSAYCRASGLLISPIYTTQRPAREALAEIIEACNADAAWCGDVLKIIPRGDEAVTGNGVTYTPNNTPVFSVGPDDFSSRGNRPVRIQLVEPSKRQNRVTVEYFDRSRKYAITPVTLTDEAAVSMYGLLPEDTRGWRLFADPSAANQAAQIRLQALQAAPGQYQFQLPWRFLQLEPGDLLALQDPVTMATSAIVKLLELTEGDNDAIDVVVEDFPIGHANAPLYAPQLASGWNPNHNVASGDIAPPVFLEPPGSSVGGTGLEVWIAASGANANWGGCDVYASLDNGATYKLVSRIDQAGRYGALQGTLTAGSGGSLDVLLAGRGGKLWSTSAFDADNLATLCFVGNPIDGEWLSFETATLTATNRYTLTGLRRGRYGSSDRAFAAGAPFVFLDSSLAQSGPLPRTMIGQVVKFKFCSYNVFGGALQSLAVAPEYSYLVTGRFMGQTGRPISANLLANATLEAGTTGVGGYFSGGGSGGGDTITLTDLANSATQKIPALPTNILLFSTGNNSSYWFAQWEQAIAVDPAKRYVFFQSLNPQRGPARAQVRWFDAAGAEVSGDGSHLGNPLASDASKLPANPAHYRISSGFTYPPATARSAKLITLMSGRDAGQADGGVYITKPFFGEALPEQTELPVWEAGGQNAVSTAFIRPGATFEFPVYKAAPTSIAPGVRQAMVTVPPVSDPAYTAGLGPWDVDVRVAITATIAVSYQVPVGNPFPTIAWDAQLLWQYGPIVGGSYSPVELLRDSGGVVTQAGGTAYDDYTVLRTIVDVPAGQRLIVSSDVLNRLLVGYVSVNKAEIGVEVTKGR